MSTIRLARLENVKYDELNGFEKAAILVNYLGPEAAKKLFKFADDSDVRKLLNMMQKYRIVPIEVTRRVLEEYYAMVSETAEFIFSERAASKETIVDAVGEERARGILGHLSGASPAARNLRSLDLVDAKSLSNFLVNEHPQTIAVILAHLDPEKKGEVLKRLPESLQGEIVLRLTNLDHVAPELIAEVDRVLKQELSTLGTVEQFSLGGVQPVADMLNAMDKNTETSILARIEEKDPILAERIRKLMFVFEDIAKIDDRGIQTILKEVPNEKLLLALKTASDEVREKLFKNISQRAAKLLQEDLSIMGPARLSDVEAAQTEIVNIARRLEQEGRIYISRGGSEDAMV
jgi:flagellar motor switch protein FliG